MKVIHDHLYGSANIRLPEDLQVEVAKTIQTLTWLTVVESLPRLEGTHVSAAIGGDRDTATALAREIREGFQAYNKSMRRYPAREILRLDDASLAFIRAALVDVDMSDAQRDWLGDALEVFRSTAAKRLGGQFFTDQQVTRLAIHLLQFNAAEDDLVDMCAGTGGFLIAGARAAQAAGVKQPPRLIGVEVDSSLAHLANSTLHQLGAIDTDPVFNADSFRSPEQWPLSLRKTLVPGTHRCLATNPPFGHKITIKDPKVLGHFSLGHGWAKDVKGWQQGRKLTPTAPDILFLERNVEFAEPGEGRLAIVLPYQILSGPKLGYVREWLLRHTYIEAVVDLPEVTFQPWTGTKTSLLVVRRRSEPLANWEPEDYPVFMSVARHIGHDRRGNPVVTDDGHLKCDLPDVAKAFDQHLRGEAPDAHPEAFVVSASAFTRPKDLRINAAFHEPARSSALTQLSAGRRSDERIATIGELTERIFFPGRFKRNYTDNALAGVPFLGGTNITQLQPTNRKFLHANDPRLDDLRVRAGWLLVTRSGSTGIVSSVPEEWDGFAMSEHVIRIIPNPEKMNPAYLEVYLKSRLGQALLAQGIFGSVIDEITPEHIASIPVPLPMREGDLERIVSDQADANHARNRAISLGNSALSLFEELVGREISVGGGNAGGGLSTEDVINQSEEFSKGKVALE